MNIFGREKFDHFIQHIFHKGKRLRVAYAEITILIRLTGTT